MRKIGCWAERESLTMTLAPGSELAARLAEASSSGAPLLLTYYLERMGLPMRERLPVDEVVAFCLTVSAGEIREVVALR